MSKYDASMNKRTHTGHEHAALRSTEHCSQGHVQHMLLFNQQLLQRTHCCVCCTTHVLSRGTRCNCLMVCVLFAASLCMVVVLFVGLVEIACCTTAECLHHQVC
jgi:hypothetical protein